MQIRNLESIRVENMERDLSGLIITLAFSDLTSLIKFLSESQVTELTIPLRVYQRSGEKDEWNLRMLISKPLPT